MAGFKLDTILLKNSDEEMSKILTVIKSQIHYIETGEKTNG